MPWSLLDTKNILTKGLSIMALGSVEGQLAANLLWQYMRSMEARLAKLESLLAAANSSPSASGHVDELVVTELGSEEGQLAANLLWQYMRSVDARLSKLESAVTAAKLITIRARLPSSSLTNRPAISTPAGNEIMAPFQRLQDEGDTIILVTHEHEHRRFRDCSLSVSCHSFFPLDRLLAGLARDALDFPDRGGVGVVVRQVAGKIGEQVREAFHLVGGQGDCRCFHCFRLLRQHHESLFRGRDASGFAVADRRRVGRWSARVSWSWNRPR
jgi:hypothetical protein